MTTFLEKELKRLEDGYLSILQDLERPESKRMNRYSNFPEYLEDFLRSHDQRLIDMIMEIIKSEEKIPNKLFVYRKNVWDVYKGRIGEKLQALKEQLK